MTLALRLRAGGPARPEYATAFNMQINHAKKLGQMPDDIKVMRETLKAFGFVMQSTQVEDISVQELLNKLGRLGRSALLFIQVVDYKHLGGNMIALGTDGFKYTLISPTSQTADAIAHYRTVCMYGFVGTMVWTEAPTLEGQ